jgi:hypothetical protein
MTLHLRGCAGHPVRAPLVVEAGADQVEIPGRSLQAKEAALEAWQILRGDTEGLVWKPWLSTI